MSTRTHSFVAAAKAASSSDQMSTVDRDQRIKSAKQKLKNYRAKQAQMEQARRQSLMITPTNNAGSCSSISSLSAITHSASMDAMFTAPSTSQKSQNRHSRTFSRSRLGHGRGHSRTSSISLNASPALPNDSSSADVTRTAPFESPASAHNNHRLSSTFVASTPHSHTRGHSRTGSRNFASAPRSRPVSLIGEARKEATPAGLWEDVSSVERLESSSSKMTADHDDDNLKTPTMRDQPIMEDNQLEDATPLASASLASRPDVDSVAQRVIDVAAQPTASNPRNSASHTRRPSRHSRRDSVSTRKESMEIMGGIGSLSNGAFVVNPALTSESQNNLSSSSSFPAQRSSRRISSQRWSGLQPASVLFGGSPDPGLSGKRGSGLDWRFALSMAAQDGEGDDRISALDKLEGRSNRQSRPSSVQLPSFEEVHGEKGMDKRASQDLLDANVKSTSSDRTMLNVPFSSSPSTSAGSSLNSPSAAEMAGSVDSSSGGDGLGTLVEEEEEEEEAVSVHSPVRERGEFDLSLDEEERRRRKEAEKEVVKRTRRTSLQPAPLKLKSRPASLFISPRPPSHPSMPSSTSQPQLLSFSNDSTSTRENHQSSSSESDQSREQSVDGAILTADSLFSQGAFGLNMSEAQRKLTIARLTGALPDTVNRSSTKPTVATELETKQSWRSSVPSATALASASTTGSTAAASQNGTPSRHGIRALRLSSSVQQHRNNADSISSHASAASQSSLSNLGTVQQLSPSTATATASASSTPNKRSSFSYNSGSPSAGIEAVTPTKSGRRSSIQYRVSSVDGKSPDVSAMLSGDHQASSPLADLQKRQQQQQASLVGSGVPLSMFEELKAKHQRDITLLDDARRAIARLESEAKSEAERSQRELSDLERWSAEEKRTLGTRIEHLEASIVEVTQVREAREEHHRDEIQKAQEAEQQLRTQLEDAQAERDMLREDVEGWRVRCADLEQKLRSTERKGGASPLLNAAFRDGSVSPIFDFDAPPPPQAIKLLKDMRQQIISLARSLEKERESHEETRRQVDEQKLPRSPHASHDHYAENTAATMSSFMTDMSNSLAQTSATGITSNGSLTSLSLLDRQQPKEADPSSITPSSSFGSNLNHDADAHVLVSPPPSSTPQRRESSGANSQGMLKKRNHVFAYDSSMESGKGSASAASYSTQQTSEYSGGEGRHLSNEDVAKSMMTASSSTREMDEKEDAEFIEGVQADLVGLGMGSLDTLAEEEEQQLPTPNGYESHVGHSVAHDVYGHERDHDLFDIEAGRRPSDVESIAPPTPALDHHSPERHSKALPFASVSATESMSYSSSAALNSSRSSSDSRMEPQSPLPALVATSQDTTGAPDFHGSQSTLAHDASYAMHEVQAIGEQEEEDEDLPPPPAARPEFIREWSFEQAMSAAQIHRSPMRNDRPNLLVGTRTMNAKPTLARRRKQNMSIDDFFGIMNIDDEIKLPPLPTPDEALDMPPLQMMDPNQSYDAFRYARHPRLPSAIRPPVARTSRMYGKGMPNRAVSPSASIQSIRSTNMPHGDPMNQAAQGAGMFSRVVSLTSAFGGYFMGAASAQQPQASAEDSYYHKQGYSRGHFDVEAGDAQESMSWAVARQVEDEMA